MMGDAVSKDTLVIGSEDFCNLLVSAYPEVATPSSQVLLNCTYTPKIYNTSNQDITSTASDYFNIVKQEKYGVPVVNVTAKAGAVAGDYWIGGIFKDTNNVTVAEIRWKYAEQKITLASA